MNTERAPDAAMLESRIRDYFAACNSGDPELIASHFEHDAKHYFPRGVPQGTLIGATGIAQGWAQYVRDFGSHWSVDHVLVDATKLEAVIEWTHTKRNLGVYLRGDEWYRFSNRGLISEIRAYYACPVPDWSQPHELGDYPYAEFGYPMPLDTADRGRDGTR